MDYFGIMKELTTDMDRKIRNTQDNIKLIWKCAARATMLKYAWKDKEDGQLYLHHNGEKKLLKDEVAKMEQKVNQGVVSV